MNDASCDIGLIGLAVMGQNLVLNMNDHGYKADVRILGIPDRLVEHGTPKELHRECAYDAQGIGDTAREMMKVLVTVQTVQ